MIYNACMLNALINRYLPKTLKAVMYINKIYTHIGINYNTNFSQPYIPHSNLVEF